MIGNLQDVDLFSVLRAKAEAHWDKVALQILTQEGSAQLSYGQLYELDNQLGFWLSQKNYGVGSRIALLCESRPEWAVAFFGIVKAGAICVAVDTALGEEEQTRILQHSGATLMIGSKKFLATIQHLRQRVATVTEVVDLEDFVATRKDVEPSREILRWRDRLQGDLDAPALIVYTSGTTDQSKGIVITARNLFFEAQANGAAIATTAQDRFLSILPLNHLFELTGGLLCPLNTGSSITYANTLLPHLIVEQLRRYHITVMIGVPLFFKSLQRSIELEINKQAPGRRRYLGMAFNLAPYLPRWARRVVFCPIHRTLGGHLRLFVCGGAPLAIDIARFFDHIGLPILQGYGLTETSPVITVNRLAQNRIGSVGRPLPGVEVKIDPEDGKREGEILTRGPHLMRGYYKNEALTRQVIDAGGWLHTGDLGYLDDDGFLYVTGRLKNLIVLGGGKKIHPEELEAIFAASPLIKEVSVVGVPAVSGPNRGHDEIWVVAVPSDACRRRYEDSLQNIETVIKDDVTSLAKVLAGFKQPHHICVTLDDLPKTSTAKIKSMVVKANIRNGTYSALGDQP